MDGHTPLLRPTPIIRHNAVTFKSQPSQAQLRRAYSLCARRGGFHRSDNFDRAGTAWNRDRSGNTALRRCHAGRPDCLADARAQVWKASTNSNRRFASPRVASAEGSRAESRLDRQFASDCRHRLGPHAHAPAPCPDRDVHRDRAGDYHDPFHTGGTARQPAPGRALHRARLDRNADVPRPRLDQASRLRRSHGEGRPRGTAPSG